MSGSFDLLITTYGLVLIQKKILLVDSTAILTVTDHGRLQNPLSIPHPRNEIIGTYYLAHMDGKEEFLSRSRLSAEIQSGFVRLVETKGQETVIVTFPVSA